MFLALVAVATVTIANQRKADPLVAEIEQFEKKVDGYFRAEAPKSAFSLEMLGGLQPDQTLPEDSKSLHELHIDFSKMKKRIEAVSLDRKEFKIDDPWVKSLAEVVTRYHAQQRRLYSNYFRNAHQKHGEEQAFSATRYDHLNLELYGSIGLELIQNESLKMKLNVAHIRNIVKGSYDRVVVGVHASDKDMLEQEALQSSKSQEGYAKLVHLIATRSRILNHHSLQRLSPPGAIQDPELNSCGVNLVSLKHSSIGFGGEYYSSLKMIDQQQKLDRLLLNQKFLSLAQGAPILSQDRIRTLFIEFFNRLPQVEGEGGLKHLMSLDGNPDDQLNTMATSIFEGIEKAFQKQVKDVLVQSSFYADDWSPKLMVDRMTYFAFEAKWPLVIAAFVGELKHQKLDYTAGGDEKLTELAQSVLTADLKATEQSWRKDLHQKLSQFLISEEARSITWHHHEQNFQTFYQSLWPIIQYGAEAVAVREHANEVRRKNVEKFVDQAWRDDPKSFGIRWSHLILNAAKLANPATAFVGRPSQYYGLLNTLQKEKSGGMMIPARGYLKKRVAPWTPDQLSQYFFNKLEFWSTQNQFPALKKQADAIQKNPVVMRSLEYFFEQLTTDFYERLTKIKLSKAELRPGSELLYHNIGVVAQQAERELYLLMQATPPAKNPAPKPAHQLAGSNMAESTFQKKSHDLIQEESSHVSPAARRAVADLFYDAMSMMGLSRSIFKKISMELVTNRLSPQTFLKLENLLDQGTVEARLPYRVAMSVLDQQLLADTMYGMAIAEQPILALQFENTEKSPALLDVIAKGYSFTAPLSLSFAETQVRSAIQRANQNQNGLVAEACRAKPLQEYNTEWRNVFRSSTSTRGILKSVNPQFEKYDESIMKLTRTQWERVLEGFLDPSVQWYMLAIGITIGVITLFTGGAGLMGMLAVGRTWGWHLGKGFVIRALGRHAIKKTLASTILAANQLALKKLGTTVVGKLMFYLFFVQVGTMGYVNLIELPAHLKYQLGVANSELGIATRVTADRKAIRAMADQIYVKQKMTAIAIAAQLLFIKPFVRDVKAITGQRVNAKRLERLGAVEGGDDILKEMRSQTYAELYREHGFVKGTQLWFERMKHFVVQRGMAVPSVTAQATKEQALNLLQRQIQRLFPSKQAYTQLIEARIAHINKMGSKAKAAVLNSRNLEGRMGRMQDWLRSNLMRYSVKGQYWDVAMDEAVKKGVTINLLENGGFKIVSKNHEVWEFSVVAYMDELLQTRTYWERRLQVLASVEMDLAEGLIQGKTSQDLLGHYFALQGADDVMRHKELFDWTLKQTSGGALPAFIRKELGTTEGIRAFRDMYRDYDAVVSEIDRLNPPAKGAAAADEAASAAGGVDDAAGSASSSESCAGCGTWQAPRSNPAAKLHDGRSNAQPKELGFNPEPGQTWGSKPTSESMAQMNKMETEKEYILYVELDQAGNPIVTPIERSAFQRVKDRVVRVFSSRFNLGASQ